ncbi:MAG: OadG family protein [Bacteroidales bacterium]|nr:OadG family protein [Bacteroidales bacterium]
MAAKDPHGLIITLVSVSVVFSALIILYFAYTFIGKAIGFDFKKIMSGLQARKRKAGPTHEEAAAIALALDQEMNGEVYAAIGMAMDRYLNDTVHDNESYIITIRRK